MIKNYTFEEDLTELVIRTLFDIKPSFKADAVYIFAQTFDNQGGLFTPALGLYKNKDIDKIAICGESEKNGYPGFENWEKELVYLGVNKKHLIKLKGNDRKVNTLSESKNLVSFAKKSGWRTVYAVSTPFHQIRAFITLLSVVKKIYPSLKVYNKPSNALPWNESALHSQGTLKALRSELIHHEIKRIVSYRRQGDLISISEVLDYLIKRDLNKV